ncbi:hypothetical protein [Colwellia sp. 20A7]|uniref:hypothetical protein n=1 Tax=Colwellia sp. 20A7 TaxID=2689569 RepID=UPI001F32A955|nr:hypothetical protein [Colwellia sp. 20A7]
MNLFKLIKAYWRGFVGGPDFNRDICHRFMLEDKQLTIKVPDSNVVAEYSPNKVKIPHTSSQWFTKRAKTYRQHCFVQMMTENWMYMPPIALFPSSEYGMFSCQLRIKQVNTINVLDKTVLSRYVTQAYDDFHNGPDGTNTELRRRVVEQSSKMARPYKPEQLEEEVAEHIELQGNPPLAPAIIKNFNQLAWVFYREIKNNHKSHNDFYCLPLSKRSFLEVKFSHRVDLSNKHKKWAKHAFASQERIMASIYLDDAPLTQEPLIG